MTSMKAVRIHNYGGPDVLTYEDAPRPTAGPGEVLIRVHATTVNPFDCAARAGYMDSWFHYNFPLILGTDVSGVIEEVGEGVTGRADTYWNLNVTSSHLYLPLSPVTLSPYPQHPNAPTVGKGV